MPSTEALYPTDVTVSGQSYKFWVKCSAKCSAIDIQKKEMVQTAETRNSLRGIESPEAAHVWLFFHSIV
jgi:hypothetical protein